MDSGYPGNACRDPVPTTGRGGHERETHTMKVDGYEVSEETIARVLRAVSGEPFRLRDLRSALSAEGSPTASLTVSATASCSASARLGGCVTAALACGV